MNWPEIISFVCYMGASHLWGYHRGQMSDRRRQERLTPYRWSCEVCLDNDAKCELTSNDMEVLDKLILDHKERVHEGG